MKSVVPDSAGRPSGRSLFYDGIFTLSGRILRTLIALVLSVLVARALGPHERGLYALPTAVYASLVLSVFTGLSGAVSYFMLNAKAGRGVLAPAFLTGAAFSAVGAVPVAALVLLDHNSWALLPSLLLLPCTVPLMILLGYALGTKRIRWQTSYAVISTSALLVGMTIAFLLFSRTSHVAVDTYVFVTALTAAGAAILVLSDARALPSNPVPIRAFATFALRVGVVNLVTLLGYRADLYVIALLTTPTVLGQYAVAISAAESLLVVTQVAAVVTSPHVGSMKNDDAAEMTAACVRTTLAVALATCIAFFIVAPFVVKVLYGPAYLPMVPALRILLVAVVILSLGSPISNYFTLKLGTPEVPLASATGAALASIVAAWFLVPRVGMIGAATATAVAYLIAQSIGIGFFTRGTHVSLRRLLIPTTGDVRKYVTIVRDATGMS